MAAEAPESSSEARDGKILVSISDIDVNHVESWFLLPPMAGLLTAVEQVVDQGAVVPLLSKPANGLSMPYAVPLHSCLALAQVCVAVLSMEARIDPALRFEATVVPAAALSKDEVFSILAFGGGTEPA